MSEGKVTELERLLESGNWAKKGDLILLLTPADGRFLISSRNNSYIGYFGCFDSFFDKNFRGTLALLPCFSLKPAPYFGGAPMPLAELVASEKPKEFNTLARFTKWYKGKVNIIEGLQAARGLEMYVCFVAGMKEPYIFERHR